MPSWITEPVAEGEPMTVKQFFARCLRASGYMLRWRDESPDFPIPRGLDKTENRAARRLKELTAELAGVNNASDAELDAELRRIADENELDYQKTVAKSRADAARYGAMIARVRAAELPEALQPVREMALRMLQESRDHDVHDETILRRWYPGAGLIVPAAEYRASRRRNLQSLIAEYRDEARKIDANLREINQVLAAFHELPEK